MITTLSQPPDTDVAAGTRNPASTPRRPRRIGRLLRDPEIGLSVLAPIIGYQVLHLAGWSDVAALSVAALFPAVVTVFVAIQAHRVDAFGALSLGTVLFGLLGALVLHDGRLLLVKDSLVTGAVGLGFLVSLCTARPLAYRLGRAVERKAGATDISDDEAWGSSAELRRGYRVATAVWGLALLLDAALRVGVSYLLPTTTVVVVSPLIAAAVLGPVAVWSVASHRSARARMVAP